LVCIVRTKLSHTKAFSYIEIAKLGNAVEGVWYRIPDNVWQQVLSAISTAQSPLNHTDMRVVPLDSRLHAIRTVYVNWFKDERCARHYGNLRPTLGHAGEDCVDNVISFLGQQNFGKEIRYLDIGCGDGELTSKIAEHLSTRGQVILTALDTSDYQLSMAKDKFNLLSSPNLLHLSLEDYHKKWLDAKSANPKHQRLEDDARFDIVTAIHSLYVVDAAYIRSIYNLLAKGGVAMIWMASGNANIIAGLTQLLDSKLRPGQMRNTAEQCLSYAELGGLKPIAHFVERKIRNLVSKGSLTEQGHELIKYCSLKSDVEQTVLKQASEFLLREAQAQEEHLITDCLLIFKRN
jgi:SAM-dependent methyltransferase